MPGRVPRSLTLLFRGFLARPIQRARPGENVSDSAKASEAHALRHWPSPASTLLLDRSTPAMTATDAMLTPTSLATGISGAEQGERSGLAIDAGRFRCPQRPSDDRSPKRPRRYSDPCSGVQCDVTIGSRPGNCAPRSTVTPQRSGVAPPMLIVQVGALYPSS